MNTLCYGLGRDCEILLLQNVGNLKNNRYISEVLEFKVVSFLRGIPGFIFRQNNAKNVQDFSSGESKKLLWCPAYLSDMSPIGRRLTRDPRPIASTDKFWVRLQEIWNSFSEAQIHYLFDSVPRRIATLIEACDGHSKN